MDKKERRIAIRHDQTDTSKVIISEELYKNIEDALHSSKEDGIKGNYNYKFYAFGEDEERFNTYLTKSEKLELKKKDNLYTVTGEDLDVLSSHFWNGDWCLANVIFHTDSDSTAEDNYNDYINYFNFYNGRVRILSIVVTEENKKPKLDIFEQIVRHNEVYRRDNVFIRVNDIDIPLKEYQSKKEDTTTHGTK